MLPNVNASPPRGHRYRNFHYWTNITISLDRIKGQKHRFGLALVASSKWLSSHPPAPASARSDGRSAVPCAPQLSGHNAGDYSGLQATSKQSPELAGNTGAALRPYSTAVRSPQGSEPRPEFVAKQPRLFPRGEVP